MKKNPCYNKNKKIIILTILTFISFLTVSTATAKLQWFGPIYLTTDITCLEEDIKEIGEFSNLIVIESQTNLIDPIEIAIQDIERMILASEYNTKTVLVLLDIFFKKNWKITFTFNTDYYSVDSSGNLIYENQNKIVAIYDSENLYGLDGHFMGQIILYDNNKAVYTTEKGNVITGVYNRQLIEIIPRLDYIERWLTYAQIIEPYIENVMGVIILDEPYRRALLQETPLYVMKETLDNMIMLIKETFLSVKTIGIFSTLFSELDQEYFYGILIPKNIMDKFEFPNFDIIGFNFYFLANQNFSLYTFRFQWKRKFNLFQKLLSSEQEIVLIPGTFYFENKVFNVKKLVKLANFYNRIARLEPKITTMMPFLWKSVESLGLKGMKDLPNEILLKWKSTGKTISKL